jgi:hypothetical protein
LRQENRTGNIDSGNKQPKRYIPYQRRFVPASFLCLAQVLEMGSTTIIRCIASSCSFLLLISAWRMSSAQARSQTQTLVVNGKSGEAMVARLNGRTYVDLESLARIAGASLAFQGNQVTLALPGPSATAPATDSHVSSPAPPTGLSRDFREAAIEAFAQMREWATTMANAVQYGYQITDDWASGYREKAATSLRQASASASTESDQNALALLTNEFRNIEAWSNELVEAKKNMATAKYTMSKDALRNEPLSQKIINCGHFLGAMLGSGDFKDDLSCH